MARPTRSTTANTLRLALVGLLCVALSACGSRSSGSGGGADPGGPPPAPGPGPGPGTGTGGGGGGVVAGPAVLSLRVAAGNVADGVHLPRGYKIGLSATALLDDGSSRDVTADVEWTSGDATVASVSNLSGTRGVVTGISVGTAVVTATDPASGTKGTFPVEVNAATAVSLALYPGEYFSELPVGVRVRFYAIAGLSDGGALDVSRWVDWGSTNAAAASVSGGIVSANAVGSAAIYATDPVSGIPSDPYFVVVGTQALASLSIELQQNDLLPAWTKEIFAYGSYPASEPSPLPQHPFYRSFDLSDHVVWASTDPSVIEIAAAPQGGYVGYVVRAVAPGTAVLTATDLATGVVGTAAYTVFAPAQLASFDVLRPSVVGGNAVEAEVDLTVPASGADILEVAVTSDAPSIVPGGICRLEPGLARTACQLATHGVASDVAVTLTATYRARTLVSRVTVSPARLRGLVAAPDPVQGGAAGRLTVALDGAAASAVAVALSSSDPAVRVPAVATIAAGASQVDVAFQTGVVAADTDVRISASSGGDQLQQDVTVLEAPPPGAVVALTLPRSLLPNVFDSISSTVTIVPDPANDTRVTITTLEPTYVSFPPQGTATTVVVPASFTTASFSIQSAAPGAAVFATVTATSGGRTVSADLLVDWVPTP